MGGGANEAKLNTLGWGTLPPPFPGGLSPQNADGSPSSVTNAKQHLKLHCIIIVGEIKIHHSGNWGSPSPPGSQETLEIPRLPDPSTLFPVAPRRKAPPPLTLDHEDTGAPERPKTLEFAPRPRPTPARPRMDPWKLPSLSRTLSSSPGSSCDSPLGSGDSSVGGARPSLLDMDMEGQSQDSTVPLCGQQAGTTLCGQHF